MTVVPIDTLPHPSNAQREAIIGVEYPMVTLEDSMGGDLAIVNAARVSFQKRSTWDYYCKTCGVHIAEDDLYDDYKCMGPDDLGGLHARASVVRSLREADKGLVNYLMRKKHGTPFEMVQFRFRISANIRVMREWQRHRIGSFNEVSTRYVEMQPEFFIPAHSDVRVQEGKAGHYIMVEASTSMAANVRVMMRESYAISWAYYQELVQSGVAKEVAAYVLPLGTMSEQIWSVNLRSLFNFVALRNHPEALREIRYAAEIVEELARGVCPEAFAVYQVHGRVTP